MGGDRIHSLLDCSTSTVDLLTVKIQLSSVISTHGAQYMTIDIKDLYIGTPMEIYEYMRVKITDIPDDIIHQYNLQKKVTKDGYVYDEVRKGMYGLPQVGFLSQQLL